MPESPSAAGARLERIDDGIAVLRLDRPRQLNALTDDAVVEILRLLDAVGRDPALRVLVLSGAGRGFCAGFDLGLAGAAPGSAELGRTTGELRAAAEALLARRGRDASVVDGPGRRGRRG